MQYSKPLLFSSCFLPALLKSFPLWSYSLSSWWAQSGLHLNVFQVVTVCRLFWHKIRKPLIVFMLSIWACIYMCEFLKKLVREGRTLSAEELGAVLGKVAYIVVQSVVAFRPYSQLSSIPREGKETACPYLGSLTGSGDNWDLWHFASAFIFFLISEEIQPIQQCNNPA